MSTTTAPVATVEPCSWGVDVDGKRIGVVCLTSVGSWLALLGDLSDNIGRFDTQADAVAAVIEQASKPKPTHCTTCGQVVAA